MLLPDPFPHEPADGYEQLTAIDWNRFRAVVFESDDWGACQALRGHDDVASLKQTLGEAACQSLRLGGTLETPGDLEALFSCLESARGCDGQPAVFTAFMPMGNPDYDAIEASGLKSYHDIGLDEGLPPGWERGNLIGKWREGVARGVFAPEFHAGLHHLSPILWLELLRDKGPQAHLARALFAHRAYAQPQHLPEYHRMNAKMQHEWVSRAVTRFKNLFGFAPRAGVNSDALPLTEVVWSVNGLETFCLKNARLHDGDIVAYHTKPWNSQDRQCPMGAYNRRNDLVYLSRNLHLDDREAHDLDEFTAAITATWARNEPVIANNHRINYVNLDRNVVQKGYATLTAVLQWLTAQENVHFLTTTEVGDLYRRGYSLRQIGPRRVLRQWSQATRPIRLAAPVQRISSLPDLAPCALESRGNEVTVELPPGNYIVE